MHIWTIAWKDTLIRIRDRNALFFMLAAPLLLSAIIGAAFGGIVGGGGSVPFEDIPVVLVNEDQGSLGGIFTEVLTSPELEGLLDVTVVDDLAAGKERVETGRARAVVYLPPGFSGVSAAMQARTTQTVTLFTDPTANVTPEIVRTIVTRIANGINTAQISVEVGTELALEYPAQLGQDLADLEAVIQAELMDRFATSSGSQVQVELGSTDTGERGPVNPLAFFAPSMALFFLSFTTFEGTRSILTERREGTLARMATTAVSPTQVLLGKIAGVFLTGILQFTVLVGASRLIFGLDWGHSLVGLALMVLAVVAALASIGALVAAFARDLNQAGVLGTLVTLVFAALGGNFYPATNFPGWLQPFSRLTVNRWGLEGFSDLTLRGLGLVEVLPEAAVLLALAAVLFALATWRFGRLELSWSQV